MDEFMKVRWPSKEVAVAELFMAKYPKEGLVLKDFIPIMTKIRRRADSLYIRADLTDVGAIPLPLVPSLITLIRDIIEYTDDDDILAEIEYINAGIFFKMLYKFVVPVKFHSLIKFSTR